MCRRAAAIVSILAIACCLNTSEGAVQDTDADVQTLASKTPSKTTSKTTSKAGSKTAASKPASKPALPAKPKKKVFSKIPFFILKDGSEKVNSAKTQEQCEKVCEERPNCKSFSYSMRKQVCFWSKNALAFNGEFTFYTKRTNPGKSSSKYRSLLGMMFLSKSFTRYMDVSLQRCKRYCNTGRDSKGRSCNAFSYRERDSACLLSPFGVTYDNDYDYFEREPRKVTVKKKVISASGKVETVKKKKKPPLDVRLQKVVPKPKLAFSNEYKTNLKVQEGEAKQGAKEVARKKRTKKRQKVEKKAEKEEEEDEEEEEEETQKAAKTQGKVQSQNNWKERSKKTKAKREKTDKAYRKEQDAEDEASHKDKKESSVKVSKQKKSMEEGLNKELKYKTRKKYLEVQTKKHNENMQKSVDTLIKSGIQLSSTERKNKQKHEKATENGAKEKVVKMDRQKVLDRRHERHNKEFAKFAKDTVESTAKKSSTDTQVAKAMQADMKTQKRDFAAVVKTIKKQRALVHKMSLRVEQLKAKANGYQHIINLSAKAGKKAKPTEVKLTYTMNEIRKYKAKVEYEKKKLSKQEGKKQKKDIRLKKLDNKMTQKGIGRRRRAQSSAKGAKKKAPPVKLKTGTKKDDPTSRRRRTQARLKKRMMKEQKQTSGASITVVPAVPKDEAKQP